MKAVKSVFLLLVGAAVLCAPADEKRLTALKDGTSFSLDAMPDEIVVERRKDAPVRFSIEENGTTGYQWRVDWNTNECDVALDHRAPESADGQCGTPGRMDVSLVSRIYTPVRVEFRYVRPWETNEPPAKAVKVIVYTVGEAKSPPSDVLTVGPAALMELLPLMVDAAALFVRASEREARHAEELKRRGVAEVPPSDGQLHVVDTAGLAAFSFDDWGELAIDRRFVTDDEMKTVRAIEGWIAKWFPAKTKNRVRLRRQAGAAGMPVFRGFEDPRYQQHDALIVRLTSEFNANKAEGCGGTAQQAGGVPDLTPAMVKAHMIEETGGNGLRSKAAWAVDPLQVNVPGDWGEEKTLVGLVKPERRNEGTAERNVRAAIRYLSRKGFSVAARPASERPKGFFDGWLAALRRYNGRRDRTETDRYYSDEYAERVLRRASNPDRFVPIEIKLAK